MSAFLTIPDEFRDTLQLSDLNPWKVVKRMPSKLSRERGQNLQVRKLATCIYRRGRLFLFSLFFRYSLPSLSAYKYSHLCLSSICKYKEPRNISGGIFCPKSLTSSSKKCDFFPQKVRLLSSKSATSFLKKCDFFPQKVRLRSWCFLAEKYHHRAQHLCQNECFFPKEERNNVRNKVIFRQKYSLNQTDLLLKETFFSLFS